MNGSLLAFTWSPAPKVYQPYVRPDMQMNACFSFINKLKSCSQFVCYPELNLNGNIHFHAIIKLQDKIKWFKSVLPTFKRNGFVLLKSNVTDPWHVYIQKDKEIMRGLLELKYCPMYNTNYGEEVYRNHIDIIVKQSGGCDNKVVT